MEITIIIEDRKRFSSKKISGVASFLFDSGDQRLTVKTKLATYTVYDVLSVIGAEEVGNNENKS